jgi:hypothetical protein
MAQTDPLNRPQETLHAGPAVAQTEVHHGVVGTRTVQVSKLNQTM